MAEKEGIYIEIDAQDKVAYRLYCMIHGKTMTDDIGEYIRNTIKVQSINYGNLKPQVQKVYDAEPEARSKRDKG